MIVDTKCNIGFQHNMYCEKFNQCSNVCDCLGQECYCIMYNWLSGFCNSRGHQQILHNLGSTFWLLRMEDLGYSMAHNGDRGNLCVVTL